MVVLVCIKSAFIISFPARTINRTPFKHLPSEPNFWTVSDNLLLFIVISFDWMQRNGN